MKTLVCKLAMAMTGAAAVFGCDRLDGPGVGSRER